MLPRGAATKLVIAVASIAYVSTAARFVIGGDAGELATLFATGGAAHPPGFPLYVLYLRAMRWIPASSPAHAAALATAVLGALSVAALARACKAWGASEGASAIAVAAYALSPIAWTLSTEPEVFAMCALFAALVLWASAPVSSPGTRSVERVAVLGLLGGLALSDHPTVGALAPVGLLAAIRLVRAARSPALAALAGLGAFAAGLLPYAYLWHSAQRGGDLSTWTWGGVHDLASFLSFVRREQYPLSEMMGVSRAWAEAMRVADGLAGLPFFAVAMGADWIFRRRLRADLRPSPERLASIVALVIAFALAGPAFSLFFRVVDPSGSGGAVIQRFDLLPMVLIVPLTALALDGWLRMLTIRPLVTLVLCVALLGANAARTLPRLRAAHGPALEAYARATLASAPPNAVILASGDQRFGAFLYARWALHLRPDVVVATPQLLLAPWYLDRLAAQTGATLPPIVAHTLDVRALLAALLATGRPLLVTDDFSPHAIDRYPSYPLGTLIRLEPDRSLVPSPLDLEARNLAIFGSFDHVVPPSGDPWTTQLRDDYARPWRALATAFTRAGDEPRARECLARAAEWSPEASP